MINDNVEVFLRRVGPRPTRYMEYVRPGHVSKFKTQSMQCYVEAATEERFQIHVRLHHGFRYYTATCLEIRLWLDAHQEPDVYLHKKVSIPSDGHKYTEYVLKDFAVQVGNHWENGLLCFGEVQIDDEKDKIFRKSELKERSVKLGSIRVSVQRGRQDADATPEEEPESVRLDSHVSHHDSLNGITHYVKTVKSYVIDTPESDSSTLFKRLAGAHGERFNSEFRYRSRAELQRLGMMDDEGRRIDPNAILEEADDELPVVPHRKAAQLGLNASSSSSQMESSSPTLPRSVLQPVASSQGLFSSPLAGYSTAKAQVPNTLGSHHPQVVSETPTQHSPNSFSAGTSFSYTPGSHTSHSASGRTQKSIMKKRALSSAFSENGSSTPPSGSPPAKKRVVLPAIDLTRSTSPTPPLSFDSAQTTSKGSSLLPSDNSSTGRASVSGAGVSSSLGNHSSLLPPPFTTTASSMRSQHQQQASPPPSAGLLPPYPYGPTIATSSLAPADPSASTPPRSDLTGATLASSEGYADDSSTGDGDNMSEMELHLELRRIEMQQRAFEIQQRQLETQQRQMEYQIRLERMRRVQRDAQ